MASVRLLLCVLLLSGTSFAHAQESGAGYEAAERAYAAAERGDTAEALEQARIAAAQEPGSREYRELLFYSLIAADRSQEALGVGATISRDFGSAPLVDIARAGLLLAAERTAEARPLLERAILSGVLTPAQEREARLIAADAAQTAGDPAAVVAVLGPIDLEVSHEVASRRGFALLALGRRTEALTALETAYLLAIAPDQRALLARSRVELLAQLGQIAAARELLERLIADGTLTGSDPDELAYLAQAAGAPGLASSLFAQAFRAGRLQPGELIDAGYNARAVGDDAAAATYFRTALAADRAGSADLGSQTLRYAAQDLHDLTHEVGGYLSITRAPAGTVIGVLPGVIDGTYAGGEVYWRPKALGRRGDVFFRGFLTLDAEAESSGFETAQGYVGVRFRPFDFDLAVEASYLFPIGGAAREDVLLRTAAGLGEGGGIRLDRRDWEYWSVYGEIGQFLIDDQTIASLDVHYGRALRLGDWTMLTPTVGARASFDSSLPDEFALGAGPALSLRQGIGGTRWTAAPVWLDAILQYRFGVAGGEQEEGIFTTAVLGY